MMSLRPPRLSSSAKEARRHAPQPLVSAVADAVVAEPSLQAGLDNIHTTFLDQTRTRGLPAYVKALGGFRDALLALADTSGGRWLDVSAGVGNAARGFMEFGTSGFAVPAWKNGAFVEPPRVPPKDVTVTLLDLQCPVRPSDHVRVVSGRPIELVAAAEIGQHDVVSDVEGAFVYSTRPDLVLAKEVGALAKNGVLFLGLGSSVNRFYPGNDSLVIGQDGVVRSYARYLQNIAGLDVKIHRQTSADADDQWESMSAEIRVADEMATLSLPATSLLRLTPDGPPQVWAMEDGNRFVADTAAHRQHEGLAAQRLQVHGRTRSTEAFLQRFDVHFASGLLSSSWIGEALSKTRGTWFHLGELNPATQRHAEGVRAFQTSTDVGSLAPAGLITDDMAMASSLRPDHTLQHLLAALADDGQLLLCLGDMETGTGRTSVLDRHGNTLTLAGWLSSIDGLDVDVGTHRRDRGARDETVVRVRISDRQRIAIPALEPLGVIEGGCAMAAIFRENSTLPARPPTLSQRFRGAVARLWHAVQ